MESVAAYAYEGQPDDESNVEDNSVMAPTVATEETGHGEDDQSEVTVGDEDDKSSITPKGGSVKSSKKRTTPIHRKGRAPAVKGLTIPFRTVKKAMKLDPDVPIVQNEAAIMTTLAVEQFLQKLAKESFSISKSRGRNTIRYEDVAEARTKDPSFSFLETLLP